MLERLKFIWISTKILRTDPVLRSATGYLYAKVQVIVNATPISQVIFLLCLIRIYVSYAHEATVAQMHILNIDCSMLEFSHISFDIICHVHGTVHM
jgi:hypothetical protein